jgi:nucleotide-binding universal stress UspA family protein
MTTHGRSGLGRLLFGSVAEAVLRRAEIPVFLMRLTEDRVLQEGQR